MSSASSHHWVPIVIRVTVSWSVQNSVLVDQLWATDLRDDTLAVLPRFSSPRPGTRSLLGGRIFPASKQYVFQLPGRFPLRPAIFSASGIFSFPFFFSASAEISRFGKRYFLASEWICFEKKFLFSRRKVFFTFPAFFPLPKGIFPLRHKVGLNGSERQNTRKHGSKTENHEANSNAKQASETTNTSKNTQTNERARKEEATRNQPINANNQTNKQPMY